ncbi:UDP-glycosyltransferase 86A2-like [Zingiber officinale]|uniref:UDP-glycosyltransferase 86A2-like n=1 Tax=Zingiber officinale TaxID=94328 RepID=UPI001C4C3FC5|nr:UDP-glycosyltransferase 86A2-like [Zingiber officinale]
MEEYSGEVKPHALFVAIPFQGHFTPSANLAVLLAARGFIVTFVTTEAFHQQILASSVTGADVFAGARSRGLDIRHELVSDGRLQSPAKDERPLHNLAFALLHLMSPHVEQLIMKLSAGGDGDTPVDVLVADSYFVWPSTLAKRFGIPYVSFWTEPALVFALFYHLPLLLPPPEDRTATITRVGRIPGVPAIEPRDLVSFFHTPEASSLTLQMIGKAFEEAKAADFVLCNTVEELEAGTVAALQEYYSGARFYSIGPITDFSGGAISTSIFPASDSSRWLDAMPPRSVLYISFGSAVQVSKRDLNEIAGGVLSSGVRFLWVLRHGSEQLPEGFEEASLGRGLVVPWCRQREVLLHPAVGGFLTHCGWNSVLESMWCGVPMLCFPQAADQPTNRKLVVEVRAGIDIGGAGEVVRAEVAKAIDGLMGGEVGGEVRREMERVRKVLVSAVAPDGSSSRNITRFVEELTRDLSEKKIRS